MIEKRNHKNGFIGYCETRTEANLHRRVLEACGIQTRISTSRDRPADYGNFVLWTTKVDVIRAREIRRGFKVGLVMNGEPWDVLLGLRCALQLRGVIPNGRRSSGLGRRALPSSSR
jgi:hypothetical protein